MRRCEKKSSARQTAIRTCNQGSSAPCAVRMGDPVSEHGFSLKSAHSPARGRDCLALGLTLPAPTMGLLSPQTIAGAALRWPANNAARHARFPLLPARDVRGSEPMSKRALPVTREQNFPEWYQAAVRDGDMAETSPVRGCMVIKPWGWGVWERIQAELDARIKETGHENCYFPLFIPMGFIAKEAEHVEGFAKEMAVVTHHRLKNEGGKLVVDPDAKLEEPLIVRPTSETIIGDAFQRWIKSYRDLPLLINQWANVVRWEMRTRLFLRTAEFLWQEGHTAHADREDAMAETLKMLEVYREFAENVLAMPVIAGEKPANERFPGADNTYSIEAMMQDGKALQSGTSHYLGTHFAEAQNIQFQNREGQLDYCHTTSWGVSTRLIGGVIMTHGDDDGLRLPPKIAPRQIVIVPMLRDKPEDKELLDYCASLEKELKAAGIRVF